MASLEHTFEEEIIAAYMINVPVVFVEGREDIKTYQEICDSTEKKCLVLAIEMFSAKGGCDGLIGIFDSHKDFFEKKPEIKSCVLGIIDRDSRDFRDTIPKCDILFLLKYYSIESHFVTEFHFTHLVREITSYPGRLAKKDSRELFERIICIDDKELINLYYASLESLKKLCYKDYESTVCYSTSFGKILNCEDVKNSLASKMDSLNTFASSKGITCQFEDILRICKGKWFLRYFIRKTKSLIDGLPEMCKEKKVEQCQYCKCMDYEKCLYKKNAKNYDENILEGMLKREIRFEGFNYIRNRIGCLGK